MHRVELHGGLHKMGTVSKLDEIETGKDTPKLADTETTIQFHAYKYAVLGSQPWSTRGGWLGAEVGTGCTSDPETP